MAAPALRATCHHAIRNAFSEHMVWCYRRHPEWFLEPTPEQEARLKEDTYMLQRLLENVLACVDSCVAPPGPDVTKKEDA